MSFLLTPLSSTLCVFRGVKYLSVHWPASLELGGEVQTREEKGAYRAESWTPLLSTIRNCLPTSFWNPGPDLSLCVEGETVQNTLRVVIGSEFPEQCGRWW